jgi:hypothetical protein
MHPGEPLPARSDRESAEREGLVGLAFSLSPSQPEGIERLMWFGESDTPMPVDVPVSVASQLKAISTKAGLDQGPISALPTPTQWRAMSKMRQLLRPYIAAQYPTLPRSDALRDSSSWWRRALRKFGFSVCRRNG